MARFSGKIHSVKFVDTSEKTIEILYGEDSKKLFSYILPLDYTNQDFLDLLEEISIEEIKEMAPATQPIMDGQLQAVGSDSVPYSNGTAVHDLRSRARVVYGIRSRSG